MSKKEVPLHNGDKILLPLFLISLLLIAFLLDSFVLTILFILIPILLISLIYSIIKAKSFTQFSLVKMKETSYVLSFSIFITMIFSIIIPYLLFHKSFFNIFIIQYIYVFPILLVFFASLYLFNYLIKKEEIQYKQLIKSSIIISLIISVIISIGLVSFSNYLYNERTEIYNKGYDEAISKLNQNTKNLYSENLPIFNEIKTHHNNFLANATKIKSTFQTFDKNLCIADECFKNIVDKAYHLIEVVVDSEIIQSKLKEANKELTVINEEKFKLKFNTLENYSKIIKDRLDYSNFTIRKLSVKDKNLLSLVESDFKYGDLNKIIERTEIVNTGWTSTLLIESDSIFYNSLVRVFKHSSIYKQIVRLIIKVSIFTEQQGKNDDIFITIYYNKDVNESIKSKVIRNKLILVRADYLFVEKNLP